MGNGGEGEKRIYLWSRKNGDESAFETGDEKRACGLLLTLYPDT